MNKIKWIRLILLITFVGCASTPITNRYLLHVDQIATGGSPAAINVGISQLSINPIYSNHGIAYQNTPYQIQFYNYHQWADAPVNLVNQTILTYLKQSNKFSSISQLPSANKVDVTVKGQILKFAEWNELNQWYGWLEVDIQIFKTQDNKLIWDGKISKKIPSQQRNPISVVKALSKATQEVAEEIAEKILACFETY